MIDHVLVVLSLLLSLMAFLSAGRAQRFWDQHEWRMLAYKELYERYGVTQDYFKRRRDKSKGKETDKDYRVRIEKIMEMDQAAAAVRDTNAKLEKKVVNPAMPYHDIPLALLPVRRGLCFRPKCSNFAVQRGNGTWVCQDHLVEWMDERCRNCGHARFWHDLSNDHCLLAGPDSFWKESKP